MTRRIPIRRRAPLPPPSSPSEPSSPISSLRRSGEKEHRQALMPSSSSLANKGERVAWER
uniref:Uncharacterized protein n=1 Tax=Oryza meridionalis TaxID=40149 RepID=A0A0E0C501_9ORYZ